MPRTSKKATPKPVTEKRKPGPTRGANKEPIECPYCGGKAHRKALQTIKGQGTYRRHYCPEGCGHYHYRHPETNAVVEVGQGPRECRLHKPGTGSSLEVEIAKRLDIDVSALTFTSMVEGRPRAIVLCLNEDDLALLDADERETVEMLHRGLLAVQAAIKVYREKVVKASKGKK